MSVDGVCPLGYRYVFIDELHDDDVWQKVQTFLESGHIVGLVNGWTEDDGELVQDCGASDATVLGSTELCISDCKSPFESPVCVIGGAPSTEQTSYTLIDLTILFG